MRNPLRSVRFYWPVLAVPLLLGLAEREAKGVNYVYVTFLGQKVSSTGGCSLQEAIYSANLHTNQAIIGINPDGTDIFTTTDCVPGTGTDTIVLPSLATITMSNPMADVHNYLGATGTPLIFSNITIEANGSLITPSVGGTPFRAFAVGGASVALPGGGSVSGTGSLTIRNAHIKGFVEKGGDGTCGGGGGMGAGGAIYVSGGQLTIENSTVEANGAIGGSSDNSCSFGGGGGLSGKGGAWDANGGGHGGGGGALGWGGNGRHFAGGGGGGTALSGANGGTDGMTAGPGGILCGGNGADANNPTGRNAPCPGGGGGGGVGTGEGGWGHYGGGGGSGGTGGNGGFGGGGGAAAGTGGFGGGGGSLEIFTGGSGHTGAGGLFGGNGSFVGAGGGGGALGGAIFNEGGSVTIRNSTFTANFVNRGTGGNNGADAGGAIFSLNGSLTVLNATISGNRSTGSAGGIEVFATSTASLNLYNTIISNNGVNECFADSTTGGRVVSSGLGNLIGFGPVCNVRIVSTADPQLGPLQNNFGNTPTMAIPTTSPAYGKADPVSSLPLDQRGQPRPAQGMSGVPDIGAFELCLTGRFPLQMPCIISPGNGGGTLCNSRYRCRRSQVELRVRPLGPMTSHRIR